MGSHTTLHGRLYNLPAWAVEFSIVDQNINDEETKNIEEKFYAAYPREDYFFSNPYWKEWQIICTFVPFMNMVELLRNMFRRAWGIIISGSATWDEIAVEKQAVNIIRKQYVYPWIALAVCLSFLFHFLYASDRAFESAILNAIITAFSLFGGYFASNIICCAFLKKSRPDLANKADCETVVAYSYTIIILIEIITTVIPSLFFLKILNMFTAYIVWEACRAIWLLKDEERGNIVLVFSIVIIFIPIIAGKIIHLMLPNA